MRSVNVYLSLLAVFPVAGLSQIKEAGSKACAVCHAELYRRYQLTAMARSSGLAPAADLPGGRFSADGVDYGITRGRDSFTLAFTRPETGVSARRELTWFIGSGTVGRSFLFSLDGFLFQSPVSFYASINRWDISPGYQRSGRVNLTRGVEPGCLNCHATGLQTVSGTQNGYRDPPILEGGVGCVKCHGDGREHVSSGGKSAIVNPAKLTGERRDSVCAQCHLTGAARIARKTPGGREYRPGDLLADYSAFFVREGDPMRVTSHFERFVQSRCRRESGAKLWCGTCHDPHGEPPLSEKAAFYRARCETCHAVTGCQGPAIARKEKQDDCAACHMPKTGVRDAQHAVYTDHSIPRVTVLATSARGNGEGPLKTFWPGGANDRDLGLAYASMDDSRALELLERAAKQDPNDLAVLRQLAALRDARGEGDQAIELYERAWKADASQPAVAANLGTLYMQRGRAVEALRLWREALTRNPGMTGTRINLAVAQFQSGDVPGAIASFEKTLEMDPDNPVASDFLKRLKPR